MFKLKELNCTVPQAEKLRRKLDDLEIQSMMFDMEIDYETLTLVEKREDTEPRWVKNWKEKLSLSDNEPNSPDQAWA